MDDTVEIGFRLAEEPRPDMVEGTGDGDKAQKDPRGTFKFSLHLRLPYYWEAGIIESAGPLS